MGTLAALICGTKSQDGTVLRTDFLPGDSLPAIFSFSLVSATMFLFASRGSLGFSVNLKDFLFSSQFGLADFVVKPTARLCTAQAQLVPLSKALRTRSSGCWIVLPQIVLCSNF